MGNPNKYKLKDVKNQINTKGSDTKYNEYWKKPIGLGNVKIIDDSGEISFKEIMNMETLFVKKKKKILRKQKRKK